MPTHTFELCFVFLISHSTFMPTLINFSAQQLIPGYVFKCVLKTLPILTDKFSLCKLGGVNSVPFSLPLTNNFNKTKAAIIIPYASWVCGIIRNYRRTTSRKPRLLYFPCKLGAIIVWHYLLPLMKNFNSIEAVIF